MPPIDIAIFRTFRLGWEDLGGERAWTLRAREGTEGVPWFHRTLTEGDGDVAREWATGVLAKGGLDVTGWAATVTVAR